MDSSSLKNNSRVIIHVVLFLIIASACGGTFHKFPKLNCDIIDIISTISAFITFYAALFTILEVYSARSASENTEKEVKSETAKLRKRIEELHDIKDINHCLSSIQASLESLNQNKYINPDSLLSIIRTSCFAFPKLYRDEHSTFRKQLSIIGNYTHSANHKINTPDKKTLQKALVTFSAELSSQAGEVVKNQNPEDNK